MNYFFYSKSTVKLYFERGDSLTEYKIGRAIVRMHGEPDREKVKEATEKFLNKVVQSKKQKARKEG